MIRIIGTFDDQVTKVKEVLSKYWSIRKMDIDISEFMPKYPTITHSEGRLLRDYEGPRAAGTWLDRKII